MLVTGSGCADTNWIGQTISWWYWGRDEGPWRAWFGSWSRGRIIVGPGRGRASLLGATRGEFHGTGHDVVIEDSGPNWVDVNITLKKGMKRVACGFPLLLFCADCNLSVYDSGGYSFGAANSGFLPYNYLGLDLISFF